MTGSCQRIVVCAGSILRIVLVGLRLMILVCSVSRHLTATHHSTAERDGTRFFYFRGFEGLELWSILFFEDHHADVTEFGKMLIERGIVHNYTPKCTDFSKTFLVLQPLKEPRVLNSFIQWTPESSSSSHGANQTTHSSSEPGTADEKADPSQE